MPAILIKAHEEAVLEVVTAPKMLVRNCRL